MPIKLIAEDEMASTRTRKPVETKKSAPLIREENIGEVGEKKKEEKSAPPAPKGIPGINALIVKRMYFPGETYSNSKNQASFKKILAKHGLHWIKALFKSYGPLNTGMYATSDGNKKLFAIYEGSNKPMTAIIKIVGTGGNFLIDIGNFCNSVGCILEDKDEEFSEKVMLTLKQNNAIYIEKKLENVTLDDLQQKTEEKIRQRMDDSVEKYIEAHRFYYEDRCESLFWVRGLSENDIRRFRRLEIADDVRWAIENGF